MNRSKTLGKPINKTVSTVLIAAFSGFIANASASALSFSHTALNHQDEAKSAERITARVDKMMERLDVNKDGVIDQADRKARQDARFARIDSDNNGSLSKAELANERKAWKEAREARREKRRQNAFDRRDKDGDGAISKEEFQASRLNNQGKRGHRGDKAHRKTNANNENKRGRKRNNKRGAKRGARNQRLLKRADQNGDGKITRAELETAIAKRYKR